MYPSKQQNYIGCALSISLSNGDIEKSGKYDPDLRALHAYWHFCHTSDTHKDTCFKWVYYYYFPTEIAFFIYQYFIFKLQSIAYCFQYIVILQ